MRIAGRDFAEAMTLPLRQAMAATRWLEGRVTNVPKSNESTEAKAALSDGDCVSQEILLTALRDFFPRVGLDAEEDTPAAKAFAANHSPYTAVVDPIDGSLLYLEQAGLWAIIVGLEREGVVEASLVAVPQEEVLIRAVRDETGAEISHAGRPFARVQLRSGGTRVLLSSGVPAEVAERLRGRGLQPVLGSGGSIGVAPLLEGTAAALRISSSDGGLSRRAWIAALALRQLGGVVEALDGPLPDQHESGVRGMIVASGREVADLLRNAIA